MVKMNKIIHGDALEVLKTLESETFDICITSPPYNIGVHQTHGYKHNPYNDDLPEEDYQQQQINVLNELHRVIKKTGSLFYNHKNRIVNKLNLTPYTWLLKTKWLQKQEIVWINGSPNFAKVRFYPFTERVYWMVKEPETVLENIISHPDYFTAKEWPAVGTGNHKLEELRKVNGQELDIEHKRQFPEQLPLDILQCFPEAQTVIDPYFGAGTTGVVAKKLGKEYLGIEINSDYIKLAEQRLDKVLIAPSLETWHKNFIGKEGENSSNGI